VKNYSLLVFDWDGTLVNSEALAVNCIQKAAANLGYPVPEAATIQQHFGMCLEGICEQLFPEKSLALFDEIFSVHDCLYEENQNGDLFEGTIETLTHLKQQGFTLAVATNKPRARFEIDLTLSNTRELFSATRCPEDGEAKPHPHMLMTLLEELKHHPQDTLMIGDSIFDMQFASNANVDALAACYSQNKKELLAAFNPVKFISDIQELKHILNFKNKTTLPL